LRRVEDILPYWLEANVDVAADTWASAWFRISIPWEDVDLDDRLYSVSRDRFGVTKK